MALATDGSSGIVAVTEPYWTSEPAILAYHFAADATPDALYPPEGLVVGQDVSAYTIDVDRSGPNSWVCAWTGVRYPAVPNPTAFLFAQAFPFPLITATTFGALTVVPANGLGVRVTWEAYADATGMFQLFRAEQPLGPFLLIGGEVEATRNQHHFTEDDFTALPRHVYYYRVGIRRGTDWTYSATYKWAGGSAGGFLVLSGNPSRAPVSFMLSQAAASPFRLEVYSVDGRLLRRLSSDSPVAAARIEWDGMDSRGSIVPSGVYFVRLETRSQTATRRIVLLR